MKNILRWIATPFAAVIGGYLAFLVATLFFGYILGIERDAHVFSLGSFVTWLLPDFFLGVGFVMCGCLCAPCENKATLGKILVGCSLLLAILSLSFALSSDSSISDYFKIIATFVGSFFSYNICINEKK